MNKQPPAWPITLAIVAFIASRALLLAAFTPNSKDVQNYFQCVVKGVDLGQVPYRDFVLEYPPAAYWCMALPRWLSQTPLPHSPVADPQWVNLVPAYGRVFRWEMLVCDMAAFLLLLAILRRRQREDLLAAAAWTYVLLTSIMAHLLLERLDVGVLCLLLIWAWAWLPLGRARLLPSPDVSGSDARVGSAGASPSHLEVGHLEVGHLEVGHLEVGHLETGHLETGHWETGRDARWPGLWQVLGYGALGLGWSFKLIPGVVMPLVVIADVRALRTRQAGLRLAAALLVFATAAFGPFAYYYRAAGPKLWSMFEYHRARGIEIESLWSTLALALRPVGLDVRTEFGYGSWNITSPLDREMLTGSTVAMALILAGGILRACWPTRSFSRIDAYRWSLLTLLALMLAAKVLSGQYLLWGLPLAMLLGAEFLSRRQFLLFCAGLIAATALTSCVLFYGYGAEHRHALIPDLDWLPVTVLTARNTLLLALLAWLSRAWVGACES